jgi:hypothetical protein
VSVVVVVIGCGLGLGTVGGPGGVSSGGVTYTSGTNTYDVKCVMQGQAM